MPHSEDQKLWEEFRQRCDAVYRKSQEEYAKFAAELESNRTKVLALCAQVDECAGLSGPALLDAAQSVRQLCTEFEAIGELPRADADDLQRRFLRAVERYDGSVAAQRASDERQSWNDLFAAANEVRLLQLAIIENRPDLDSLRQSVRATIDGIPKWPKGGLQAIERKLSQTPSTDLAANEAALRNLCIRAEILTGIPTPRSDLELRRSYQLQHLVQGFGQSGAAGREQIESLVFEWIGTGATNTAVYYEILERFNACWMKGPAAMKLG